MNYTTGKWEALPKDGVVITRSADGEVGHVIARYISPRDINLIAASPELYEAARQVVEESGPSMPPTLSAIDKLRQALAKAEGK